GILLVSASYIKSTANNVHIDSSNTSGDAGDIVMVAGANAVDHGTFVTLSASTNTGDIDLVNGANSILSLTSTGSNGVTAARGGNITLVAYGDNISGGNITLPGSLTVTSGGS